MNRIKRRYSLKSGYRNCDYFRFGMKRVSATGTNTNIYLLLFRFTIQGVSVF